MKRGLLALWLLAIGIGGFSCSGQNFKPKVAAEPSKTLVVFHSLGGNTLFVARAIAQSVGADLVELKTREELGIENWKPVLGGREIGFEAEPELAPIQAAPGAYDLIFLGTPVWNGRHSVVLNSFFSTYPLKGKKIALFCTYANSPHSVFDGMRERLGGNEIIGQHAFRRPLSNQDQVAREAEEWARGLLPE